MLQLTGCLLIIAGCTGIAAVLCGDLRSRLLLLRQISEIYEDMKYYISYQKATVPETLLRLSEREKEPFSEAFLAIYERMNEQGGNLPEIWREQMEKALAHTPLQAKEKKLMLDFPSCLGYMEEGAQAGALNELLREAVRQTEELSGEQKNKNKMMMSLGVAGGVLLSIMLL